MSIDIKGISKWYGGFKAVDDIDLHLPTGQLTALLGPSGSGKTTLLRMIAGLEQPSEGAVLFNGQDATHLHVSERGVGFVFQHYALFKHMTVFDNIAFGLAVKPRRERPSKQEVRERVEHLLDLVQLSWTAERYPTQLSGGQRQRIALARALATKPDVLLLDEPFGALDAQVRTELRRWLRRLHEEIHVTTVFVTHDQEEAMEVADRIVVMNRGRVEQEGTPDEVYDRPATPFVYNFLGQVNRLHGRLSNGRAHFGDLTLAAPEYEGAADEPAVAYVRPHEIRVTLETAADAEAGLAGTVQDVSSIGARVRLEVGVAQCAEPVQVELSRAEFRRLGVARGDRVRLHPTEGRVFVEDTDRDSLSAAHAA